MKRHCGNQFKADLNKLSNVGYSDFKYKINFNLKIQRLKSKQKSFFLKSQILKAPAIIVHLCLEKLEWLSNKVLVSTKQKSKPHGFAFITLIQKMVD